MTAPVRVVIDTNVVVSAMLKPEGLERTVLKLALTGHLALCLSTELLAEYEAVLARPKLKLDPKDRDEVIDLIKTNAIFVTPTRELDLSSDPSDNKIINTAVEAGANFLVTGNLRHFPSSVETTVVVNARQFLERLTMEFLFRSS